MEILDIIIYNNKGQQVVSKSQVFNEFSKAAGFFPLISVYMTKLSTINLPLLILEKHKIVFQRLREITGAIILNARENEEHALQLLNDLLNKILLNGLENANKIIKEFSYKDYKNENVDSRDFFKDF